MHFYDKKVSRSVRQQKSHHCNLSIKSLEENGVFAGYGSVFDVVDNQKDIVLPGAFRDTLQQRGQQVKLLWQHDMAEPIGTIEALKEDENGLYIQGRLLLDIARAREAYSLLKEGVVKGLSIGYSPSRYRIDPDTGVRLLEAVDLWEVSLVTFPANESALITVVKSDAVAPQEQNEEPTSAEWKKAVKSGMAITLSDALDKAAAILENRH